MYALASLGSPPLLRGRRGTMCTAKGSDVRPGVPWVSASFAWQAWHNVHCQGVGCTPWRPLGLRLFCVEGVGQCALPRGSDVRPGVPWVSASFAWQAWHNVHCQGVGCTPWRPLGLRLFCVAGVGQCALPRGRMYALASPGSPPLLRGRRVRCQGVGCTPWRPLGLRLFCVAGVAQCALPATPADSDSAGSAAESAAEQLVHHGLIYRKAHPLSWRAIGRQQLENMNKPASKRSLAKGQKLKKPAAESKSSGSSKDGARGGPDAIHLPSVKLGGGKAQSYIQHMPDGPDGSKRLIVACTAARPKFLKVTHKALMEELLPTCKEKGATKTSVLKERDKLFEKYGKPP